MRMNRIILHFTEKFKLPKRKVKSKAVFSFLLPAFLGLFVFSCETATFSSRPPVKKELDAFPASFKGEWIANEPSGNLYVTRFLCNSDTLFYEMENIAPGALSPQVLQKGKMELYYHKKAYYLCVSGPDFWLPYVIKQPRENELVVYGFGKETAKYVKLYEANDWQEGLSYVVFHPTPKEWKLLMKSSALIEICRFRRKK